MTSVKISLLAIVLVKETMVFEGTNDRKLTVGTSGIYSATNEDTVNVKTSEFVLSK